MALKYLIWLPFIISFGSFFGAIAMQLLFDAKPCLLCVMERAGFLGVAISSLVVAASSKKAYIYPAFIVQILSLGWLLSLFYEHMGVELGWWLATCEASPKFILADYIPYIFDIKGLCGQNAFYIMGIDIVFWGVFSTALLVPSLAFSFRKIKTAKTTNR